MLVANTALTYSVRTDGRLFILGTGTATQPNPRHITISRDDRFAYVAFEDGDNSGGLLLYNIDSSSGELNVPQWVDSEAAGINPGQTVLSPAGDHAYVLATGSEVILTFDVSTADGRVEISEVHGLGLAPKHMAPQFVGQ